MQRHGLLRSGLVAGAPLLVTELQSSATVNASASLPSADVLMWLTQAMCSLLFLSCIALALPSASAHLYSSREFSHSDLLHISHGTAVLLVITYGAFLYFQLGTHRDDAGPSGGGGAESSDDGGGDEVPSLSLAGAVLLLTVITVVVAFCSECGDRLTLHVFVPVCRAGGAVHPPSHWNSLSLAGAVLLLAVTIIVAFCAECRDRPTPAVSCR